MRDNGRIRQKDLRRVFAACTVAGEASGRSAEPMTVLTAEDPTVLADLINPQGRTTEAELEVA
ncbi:MAG: hypothetical protein WBO12_17825 [Xanthobacteraceae bacterium]